MDKLIFSNSVTYKYVDLPELHNVCLIIGPRIGKSVGFSNSLQRPIQLKKNQEFIVNISVSLAQRPG